MMAAETSRHLLDRLPPLTGRMQADAPLAAFTWFRVGGPAEILVRPSSPKDLATLLAALPEDAPLTVIGAASNLIVRDGGITGVVVRLARGFSEIIPDATGIVAGAAALDATVAEYAAAAGLPGWNSCPGSPAPSAAQWR